MKKWFDENFEDIVLIAFTIFVAICCMVMWKQSLNEWYELWLDNLDKVGLS